MENAVENTEVETVVEEGSVEAASGEESAIALTPAVIEALLFASSEPLSVAQIAELTRAANGDQEVVSCLDALKERYASEASGIELVEVAKKYQLRTKVEFAEVVRNLKKERPKRLSLPALETLAVIAYRQPITKADIELIRGVDPTPTLKTLLDKQFVKIVGHLETVGHPALYSTTEEFLKVFGLNTLKDLPTLRDIAEIDADPGELGASEQAA